MGTVRTIACSTKESGGEKLPAKKKAWRLRLPQRKALEKQSLQTDGEFAKAAKLIMDDMEDYYDGGYSL